MVAVVARDRHLDRKNRMTNFMCELLAIAELSMALSVSDRTICETVTQVANFVEAFIHFNHSNSIYLYRRDNGAEMRACTILLKYIDYYDFINRRS